MWISDTGGGVILMFTLHDALFDVLLEHLVLELLYLVLFMNHVFIDIQLLEHDIVLSMA